MRDSVEHRVPRGVRTGSVHVVIVRDGKISKDLMGVSFSSFYVFVITASQEYILAEFAEGPFVGDAIVMVSGDLQVPKSLLPPSRMMEDDFQNWVDRLRNAGLDVDANVSMNE